MDDHLLDSHEAAAYLGLTYAALSNMRARGAGPPYLKLGTAHSASVRYRRDALEQWLRQRERPKPQTVTKETMMNAIQQVLDQCAHRHRMIAPYDVIVTDAEGQKIGRRVGENFDRALPGMPGRIERAFPPFTVEVTDAAGECRQFDVGIVRAGDGRHVPDVRPTRH